MNAFLSRMFGTHPPSAADLTSYAEADAAAEVVCARSEAIQRAQAAELQRRTQQQSAMRQMGLDALDAAIAQGNPQAVRMALELLEREYNR